MTPRTAQGIYRVAQDIYRVPQGIMARSGAVYCLRVYKQECVYILRFTPLTPTHTINVCGYIHRRP